jgi:hypothetical protein
MKAQNTSEPMKVLCEVFSLWPDHPAERSISARSEQRKHGGSAKLKLSHPTLCAHLANRGTYRLWNKIRGKTMQKSAVLCRKLARTSGAKITDFTGSASA